MVLHNALIACNLLPAVLQPDINLAGAHQSLFYHPAEFFCEQHQIWNNDKTSHGYGVKYFFQDGHYFQDGHHNIGLLAIMLCIEVINGENMFTMINYASICETRDVYAFFITGFAVVRSS